MANIDYASIDAYCKDHIRHYEERVSIALDRIGEDRCPLYMADSRLYDEMVDAIRDWCDDNMIPYGEDDIDPEEVLFNS